MYARFLEKLGQQYESGKIKGMYASVRRVDGSIDLSFSRWEVWCYDERRFNQRGEEASKRAVISSNGVS